MSTTHPFASTPQFSTYDASVTRGLILSFLGQTGLHRDNELTDMCK